MDGLQRLCRRRPVVTQPTHLDDGASPVASDSYAPPMRRRRVLAIILLLTSLSSVLAGCERRVFEAVTDDVTVVEVR